MRALLAIGIWWLFASSAGAQDRIALGADAAVQRTYVPCAYSPGVLCSWWQPSGRLTFGGLPDLERATTFARAASGRIVAMLPALTTGYGAYPAGGSLLYTDDLGETWRLARWPDPLLAATAIAFDPVRADGVAVGADGSVWSTSDEGLTWRRRRSSTGAGFRRVWVRARTCVIEDVNGALWISRDGGFALESLAARGSVDDRAADLVIVSTERTTRIEADGAVRRE